MVFFASPGDDPNARECFERCCGGGGGGGGV